MSFVDLETAFTDAKAALAAINARIAEIRQARASLVLPGTLPARFRNTLLHPKYREYIEQGTALDVELGEATQEWERCTNRAKRLHREFDTAKQAQAVIDQQKLYDETPQWPGYGE